MSRSVCALLGNCCPSAIIWRVVAVVVDPINRMLGRRSFAHIRQEIPKIAPAITNRDPATAVARISVPRRVSAALNHAEPYRIDRMIGEAVRTQRFTAQAATRFSLARSQAGKQNHRSVAAVTTAPPMGAAIFAIACDAIKRDQSTKTFTGDVDQFGHGSHHTTKWVDMLAEAGAAV